MSSHTQHCHGPPGLTRKKLTVCYPQAERLPEFTQMLYNPDEAVQEEATREFRKLLSIGKRTSPPHSTLGPATSTLTYRLRRVDFGCALFQSGTPRSKRSFTLASSLALSSS